MSPAAVLGFRRAGRLSCGAASDHAALRGAVALFGVLFPDDAPAVVFIESANDGSVPQRHDDEKAVGCQEADDCPSPRTFARVVDKAEQKGPKAVQAAQNFAFDARGGIFHFHCISPFLWHCFGPASGWVAARAPECRVGPWLNCLFADGCGRHVGAWGGDSQGRLRSRLSLMVLKGVCGLKDRAARSFPFVEVVHG